jgi:phenylacetate-coenzyme A ligase PaaK-like adenylate-forming protein
MILKIKPDYIIGYSHSLDRLARSNSLIKDKFSVLNIKVVIGAAESFPFNDSIKVISDTFGTKVAMEYGSVETNLIAHTHPSGGYWAFWKDYFIETIDSEFGNEVFITSLYSRKTPLFRYKIGDCINFDKKSIITNNGSVIKFSSVNGRSNKPIILMSGKQLHSEVVSHIIRDNKKITGYQFICKKDSVHLCLTTNNQFKDSIDILFSDIKHKASKINSELSDNLQISIVDKLEQTIAGKTPMVIYDI